MPDLESIEQVIERLVRQTLAHCRWNISHVARSLGVDRRTVYRMLERYQIERPSPAPVAEAAQ